MPQWRTLQSPGSAVKILLFCLDSWNIRVHPIVRLNCTGHLASNPVFSKAPVLTSCQPHPLRRLGRDVFNIRCVWTPITSFHSPRYLCLLSWPFFKTLQPATQRGRSPSCREPQPHLNLPPHIPLRIICHRLVPPISVLVPQPDALAGRRIT